MADRDRSKPAVKVGGEKEMQRARAAERRAAALRANLARRKQQARDRLGADETKGPV